MPRASTAMHDDSEPAVWVLTDGKAGDELPCLGVAEQLTAAPEIRRVKPRRPFAWLMPLGPIDPREAPERPQSPLRPPFPDIAIASGRRAVAYLRALKQASNGLTFTVFLKDPRTGPGSADLIWVSGHDKLRGDNVLVTITSPHRLTPEKLAAARAAPPAAIARLGAPRVAVLVGGDSRHHRFTPADIMRFAEGLDALARTGVRLMGSPSRRTPPALAGAVAAVFARHGGWWWDGTGENPYPALLATAEAIIVTADSTNMIGEAAATGRPVLVFEPSGGHAKIAALIAALEGAGVVHRFCGRLEGEAYEPMDSTPIIADAIRQGWLAHRAALVSAPRRRI
ncbi:mitochondrial fission ELM1 family protein [Bosea sp. (in: a-proteobacteria)]|uniref:mitochondrial fission ELM1 family protein n=1 Tax=Bosea sp. (in: a-proteobacteria) TaxID=1871050 RepID=UPI00260C2E4A|nr:mitochondrial fission ELM1 family protein [Bosea sp. (in: a-proteobacteria)]MCO5091169.1 mitochondrial fission ELM1 family protein [Bosea sp. (in: a-proteobacteria)]